MLRRIGVASVAIALLLPLVVIAQKGGRLSAQSSRSSSNKSTTSSVPKKSTVTKRSSNGKILRSSSARADFMRHTGYPNGRRGYVLDHILPLECGGADVPSNIQRQTLEEAKIKDRSERNRRGSKNVR